MMREDEDLGFGDPRFDQEPMREKVGTNCRGCGYPKGAGVKVCPHCKLGAIEAAPARLVPATEPPKGGRQRHPWLAPASVRTAISHVLERALHGQVKLW